MECTKNVLGQVSFSVVLFRFENQISLVQNHFISVVGDQRQNIFGVWYIRFLCELVPKLRSFKIATKIFLKKCDESVG